MDKKNALLINKVFRFIRKNSLINPASTVLAAVSGGKDSMVMLDILNKLKNRLEISLYALYLDHGLRPLETGDEIKLIEAYCFKEKIPFYKDGFLTKEFAKTNKTGIEEAARLLSYSKLREFKNRLSADYIATAHSLNDSVETILMRFLKGSFVDGLTGIEGKTEKQIIRPLLELTTNEIYSYAESNHLKFSTDSSNLSDDYCRNFIRNSLLPEIEKAVNPNITKTLHRSSLFYKTLFDFLTKTGQATFNKAVISVLKDEIVLDGSGLISLHDIEIMYSVKNAIQLLLGDTNRFGPKELLRITAFLKKEKNGILQLPRKLSLTKSYDKIIIKLNRESTGKINEAQTKLMPVFLQLGAETLWKPLNLKFTCEILDTRVALKPQDLKEKNCYFFNFSLLKFPLIVRSRKSDDIFFPLGCGFSKTIKKIFIDRKYERSIRNKIPLILSEDEIVFIYDYTISEKYKILNTTGRILKLVVSKME